MARQSFRSFGSDQSGAVAASYAIALPMLIMLAGVGFDYGRMVALDSELQNAADQAALAGATQLDGTSGSCQRAADAARKLVRNETLLASGPTMSITVPAVDVGGDCTGSSQVRFWKDRDRSEAADSDETAKFIEVVVDERTVVYALTAVGGAVGPDLSARAMAGMASAICKVPPVMMCNPDEPTGNTDVELDFDGDAFKGIGLRLVANNSYSPGSFGFLETQFGNGANNLLAALGWNAPPGDCVGTDGVEIKNGLSVSVIDGLNTRFDMPGNGNNCPSIGGVAGACWPSVNVRKGLVRGNNCNGGNAWSENASTSSNFATRNYRPTTAAVLPSTVTPQIMGHPRDICHAFNDVGNCSTVNGGKNARFGTGDWDINAYWRSNYGSNYAGQVTVSGYGAQPKGYPTRYQVYRWEADNIASTIATPISGQGSTKAYSQPQAGMCMAMASAPYGVVPTDGGIDRRRISVAVLNCNALAAEGSLNNRVLDVARRNWVDVFLVEPSYSRTMCTNGSGCNTKYSDKSDVYVEVIGRTDIADGGQTVRRDVPYLIQ